MITEKSWSENPLVNKIILAFTGGQYIDAFSLSPFVEGEDAYDAEEDRKQTEEHYRNIINLLEKWIQDHQVTEVEIAATDESLECNLGSDKDPKQYSEYIDHAMASDEWYDLTDVMDSDHRWFNAGEEVAWNDEAFFIGSGCMVDLMITKK